MMPAARAVAISRWHEDAYIAMKREGAAGQRFDYQGLDLWVPADVQPITGMSHLLGEAVVAEVRATDRVLDMGTGCGVNALLAARTADDVLGVDINRIALNAARHNAHTNGLSAKVIFEHSDVFSNVSGAFDLIIFDPPFRWFRARDLLEAGITDPSYRTLTTFFAQARSHLLPDGRMLMFFSTSGDIEFFRVLSRRARFATEILSTATLERDGFIVEYLIMRLT
jgi:release factor glutamine methyltransferase